MPLSEKRKAHLEKVLASPNFQAKRFQKGHEPWNKGTKIWVDRLCQFCGKEFKIAQSTLNRKAHRSGTYCSKDCFYNAKKKFGKQAQARQLYNEGKTFKEIGEIMGILPSTASGIIYRLKINSRFGDGIFQSSTRDRMRHLLAEDSIITCELCGYSRATEVAHITEKKNGGRYLKSNCILLCPNCHHLFDHRLLNIEEKQKLLSIARLNGNLARRLK